MGPDLNQPLNLLLFTGLLLLIGIAAAEIELRIARRRPQAAKRTQAFDRS